MMRARAGCVRAFALLLLGALASVSYAQVYPALLPPESAAMKALEDAPQIRSARAQLGVAEARRAQLDAGPYEWTVGATGQQRKDAIGATFSEQSYELSRTLRAFGKAGLDRELGARTVEAGTHAFEDAWHEAARTMLAGWFDWLRAVERDRALGSHVELLRRQLGVVQSRVRTGDAPRLQESLAQAELDGTLATQIEAQLRVQETTLTLRRAFPALDMMNPAAVDVPHLPEGADDAWIARIVGHNHEIELAETLHDQAQIAARRAARDRVPDPAVALRFSNDFDGNDRVVGVVVTLPIGGARRAAAHSQALSEVNVAGQRARETHLSVETEATRVVAAMRAGYARWQRIRDVSERSRFNADAVARGYGVGEFTISEMLTARRQALEAELAEVTARLDAFENIARLYLDAHEIWSPEMDAQEG